MEKWIKLHWNFIRRVSKSIVKCCSVEFFGQQCMYKFFCLSKQFLFFYFFFFWSFGPIFFWKNSEKQENKLAWPYGPSAKYVGHENKEGKYEDS